MHKRKPYRVRPSDGRLYRRFMSPPNAIGVRKQLFVICPPDYNTPTMLTQLAQQAIDRHVKGLFTTSETFQSYVNEKFMVEYPAAKNLAKSSTDVLRYLFDKLIFPHIGSTPLAAVSLRDVTQMQGKLREAVKAPLTERSAAFWQLMATAPPRGLKLQEIAKAIGESRHVLKVRLFWATKNKRLTRVSHGRYRMTPGQKADAPTGEEVRAYSDRTIRHAVIAVSSVLRWAKKNGDLAVMPDIEAPKVAQARKPVPYTQEEAQLLIGHARNAEDYTLFLLLFDGGLRISEALGINPAEQINFKTHSLKVDRQFYRGTLKHTKNGRERTLIMSPQLEDALAGQAARGPQLGRVALFVDKNGKRRRERWVAWAFKRAEAAAGIRHVRIHDSRHSFATMRTAEGVTPFALQKLMGHSDVRTTQGYVHPETPQPSSILDKAVDPRLNHKKEQAG